VGGSPFVLLDGIPSEIPGPIYPHRDTVSITLLDVQKMLQSGALLNDQVIHGYIMNLLGTQFGGWLGLRVVSTHFYAKFAHSRNWNQVNRWVRAIGNTGTNWETGPIISIPTFLGPKNYGQTTMAIGQNSSSIIWHPSLYRKVCDSMPTVSRVLLFLPRKWVKLLRKLRS
jgi:hypothetical protein